MMKGIKRFIRKNFVNESHPFLWSLLCRRKLAQLRHRSQMSYAEIESEISMKYERVFGRKMDWDNPQTYNEKIHVSKVYMPSPLKTRLADKYLVREWIREKIGEEYLIPLLGVYDSFDEIDFDALPDKFVIKCNHDSGSYTLVKDKSKLDLKILKRKYDFWLKRNFAFIGFEMHYRDIKPRIVIEQLVESAANNYEFLCFDGVPYFCWVDFDHLIDRRRNVYNMNWELQPFNISRCNNYPEKVSCPEKFDTMKELASILSQGFNMVRVDFYFADGKIYFEEMTFTSGNGFSIMSPDEYDYKLGELWQFDNTIRRKILSERTHP